jgi:hypothetical protein
VRAICEGLIDHGRLEWQHTLLQIRRCPEDECRLVEKFERLFVVLVSVCNGFLNLCLKTRNSYESRVWFIAIDFYPLSL